MTGFSFPSVLTVTVEVIDQVATRASIVTGALAAVIYVGFTVGPLPAVTTDALVGVDTIDTSASIFAWVALTVINILMAVCPSKAFVAVTGEFASRLTLALPVGTTDVGGNVPHPFRRVIGSHSHCTAVDHFTGGGAAMVFKVGAVLAFIVLRTLAEIVAGTVEALGTILAGIGLAIIYVQLTEVSRETSGTQTLESVDFILTVTPIQTGVAGAFIDVSLTVIACIARWTDTAITINQIPTGGIILTLAKAVINIYVTVLSRPARQAIAVVAANQILTVFGVDTRFGLTFICIYLACSASPLGRAHTLKSIHQVLAGAPVETVIWRTVINVCGACGPGPARRTLALKPHGSFLATALVVAGIREAGVLRNFTDGS